MLNPGTMLSGMKEKIKMTKLGNLIGKVKDKQKSLGLVAIMNTLPLVSKIKQLEEETAEMAGLRLRRIRVMCRESIFMIMP